jgi:hypothetical protein
MFGVHLRFLGVQSTAMKNLIRTQAAALALYFRCLLTRFYFSSFYWMRKLRT